MPKEENGITTDGSTKLQKQLASTAAGAFRNTSDVSVTPAATRRPQA